MIYGMDSMVISSFVCVLGILSFWKLLKANAPTNRGISKGHLIVELKGIQRKSAVDVAFSLYTLHVKIRRKRRVWCLIFPLQLYNI
jgi:hypothetical protein